MELQSVNSDHLREVGYDEDNRTLRVRFNDESLYEYDNVAVEVYSGLIKSPSKGHYFRTQIKGRYRFFRVE